jgi:hypothetical protein
MNLDALDVSPGQLVIIALGSGPGLSVEELFDRQIAQIRSVGLQGSNYQSAEQLAQDVDKGMIAIDHSQSINNKWVLSVVRSGGGPALLLKDDADRYHFTCNYVVEVQY